ncbi:hypothetical protein P9112_009274 [Eukaryota sp. TZLM1-RC]
MKILLLLCLVASALCSSLILVDGVNPSSIPNGAPFSVSVTLEAVDYPKCTNVTFEVFSSDSVLSSTDSLICPNTTFATIRFPPITLEKSTRHALLYDCSDCTESLSSSILVIPGILTLLPACLTILIAATTQQVIPALFAGVFCSAMLASGSLSPLNAFKLSIGKYFVDALADHSHASLSCFFVFLGAIIGLISKSGGSQGLAELISKFAKTSTLAQFGLLGMTSLMWFDEFTNILISGMSLKLLLSKLKVSPAKMAFILDSMGSCPTAIFIITSWIGFEVSLLKGEIDTLGLELDPFMLFIRTVPYCFYPIAAIAFVFITVGMKKDFKAMAEVETEYRISCNKNKKNDESHQDPAMVPDADKPQLARNAVVPILITISLVVVFIVLSGREAIYTQRDELESAIHIAHLRGDVEQEERLKAQLDEISHISIALIFSNCDPYESLLYGIAFGVISCFFLMMIIGISFGKCVDAFIAGFKDISSALLILWLAWALGNGVGEVGTAKWLGTLVPDNFPPTLLILSLLFISSLVSFAAGSAWGTFVITIPLAFALVHGAYPFDEYLLKLGLAAVISGSLMGNHSSILADTTIVSSIAAGCDLMEHFKTQLPYGFVLLFSSALFGFLPAVWIGLNPIICSVLVVIGATLVLYFFGTKVPVFRLNTANDLEEGLLDSINSD